MKWDPTGHMLACGADGETDIKIWTGRQELNLAIKLQHRAEVTTLLWSDTLGKGEKKQLLLARYNRTPAVCLVEILPLRSTAVFIVEILPLYLQFNGVLKSLT